MEQIGKISWLMNQPACFFATEIEILPISPEGKGEGGKAYRRLSGLLPPKIIT